MALEITGYVDPGSYQAEVIVPTGVAANSIPFTLGLVGIGSRNKRAVNEAVIRGQIVGEDLGLDSTLHTDSLVQRAVRRQSFAAVYKDTVPLANTSWLFKPASIQVDNAGPYTFSATQKTLGISFDGKAPIFVDFTVGGTGALSVAVAAKANTSNQFTATVTNATLPAITAFKAAEVAAAVNAALVFATDAVMGTGKGYGATYGAVATVDGGGKVVFTSPSSDVNSDVAVWLCLDAATDASLVMTVATNTIVGSDTAKHAKTVVQVNDYNVASVYTIDYVAYGSNTDPFVNASVQSVSRVGNFAGVTSYATGVDYTQVGDTVSWAGGAWVSAKVTAVAGTYNVATNKYLSLSIDGKTTITIDLSGASLPAGVAAPASPAAATAAELALVINHTLAHSKLYGPFYGTLATSPASVLTLTSPTKGQAGIVEVSYSSTFDASSTVFGLASSQLPYDVRGVGLAPPTGQVYYASYAYTRPDSEYNVAKRFVSLDAALADVGAISPGNALAIAANIAFRNGAPSVFMVQVNDSTLTGSPTQLQVQAALDAAGDKAEITEVVVLDTRTATMTAVMDHLTTQCGPMIQHPRRGWLGTNNAPVGDTDTAGSFVYLATTTLQVPADSPARGRIFIVAPGKQQTTIILEDGSEQVVTVDGNYVAVAVAARFTARTSVAQAMVGTQIVGFNTDTFPVYRPLERKLMASNGVLVVTNDNGKLVMLDPLSTEAGGGKLPQFEEPSASSQKDNIVVNVNKSIESNVMGVVPTDLADFVYSIKVSIGGVLVSAIESGAIAPYRDATGRTRGLNYQTDIQVFQMKSDPRKYTFRYYFNLRYPGKRFFGEYSVDNPFFSGGTTGLIA
jgi:hypothetical protein